jgi:hypothetical protein
MTASGPGGAGADRRVGQDYFGMDEFRVVNEDRFPHNG